MLQLLHIPNPSQEWEAFLQVLDHLILHFIMGIMETLTPHMQHLSLVCRNQLCLLDHRLLLGLYHLVHISSARTTSKVGPVQQDNSHIGDFQELVHEIYLTSISSLWLLHCHLGFKALHLRTIQDLPILPAVFTHSQPPHILHPRRVQHNLLTS